MCWPPLARQRSAHTAGTTDYDSPTIDTANGLWDSTVPADDNDLVFTLANNKGDVTSAGTSPFTGAEDAGYVVLKSLVAGTRYWIELDLAADNTAAVIAELSNNTFFESVGASGTAGYDVRIAFIAPADGDLYFAWDNVGANALGDDVSAVRRFLPGELAFNPTVYTETEGDSGTTTKTITVTRTGGSDGAVSVQYATSDGTATTADDDYVTASDTLNWADGDDADKTFDVTINGDGDVELDETVNLALISPTGDATLGDDDTAVLTIENDDALAGGILAFSATSYSDTEGDSDTKTKTITVTRTGGSEGAVSVQYATSDGTATTGDTDYDAASGTLNWLDGDAADKTFTVTINGDTTEETDETVNLTLSSVTGSATLGDAAATLTIQNDDEGGELAFNSATFSETEGDSGTRTATITVSRTVGSDGAVSVQYATSDGTATIGDTDYDAASGTLNWDDGDAADKTFTVTLNGDVVDEGDETVNLQLNTPGGGAVVGAQNTAVLTIQNDDDGGELVFDSATYGAVEDDSGSKTVTITVSRTVGSDGAVSVQYATSDGTATLADSDYEAASGTFNWGDTETDDKTFTVTINGDTTPEPNETVTLTLSSPGGGGALGAQDTATLTIENDDVGAYDDIATGDYDADGTWTGGASNPANGAPDVVTIDSHRVTVTGLNQLELDTIKIYPAGSLYMDNGNSAGGQYADATVELRGGTNEVAPVNDADYGGDFVVYDNSTWVAYDKYDRDRTLTFDSLEFAVSGKILDFENEQTPLFPSSSSTSSR